MDDDFTRRLVGALLGVVVFWTGVYLYILYTEKRK